MRSRGPLTALSALCALLATIAAAAGLLGAAGPRPVPFTTVRGQEVLLHGAGLYRYDSVFAAAGYRGQDLVMLVLAVPLLAIAAVRFRRRGAPRDALALSSVLAYVLYVHASMALGAAYNELFLVYVALFSASFLALLLVTTGLREVQVAPSAPRRGLTVFLLLAGGVTAVVWLMPVVDAMARRAAPAFLDHDTTSFTYALDLAVITPATLVAALQVRRGLASGFVLAAPLLGTVVLLAPTIAAATWFQVRAGIVFSPAEIAGPISGFLLLGGTGLLLLVRLLRAVPG